MAIFDGCFRKAVTAPPQCRLASMSDSDRYRLRCAVNVAAWQLGGGSEGAEWALLNSLLTPVRPWRRAACGAATHPRSERPRRVDAQEERGRVAKFVHLDDRKRSLVSLLLQRWACEQALGVPFRSAELRRTKGGKPFLTARLAGAPAWPVTDGNPTCLVSTGRGGPSPWCCRELELQRVSRGRLRRPGLGAAVRLRRGRCCPCAATAQGRGAAPHVPVCDQLQPPADVS